MEQFHVLVSLIRKHSTQLPDEFVRVCHVQWPKVRVERLIDQFLHVHLLLRDSYNITYVVDVKKVGVIVALRRPLRTYPVQFIYMC